MTRLLKYLTIGLWALILILWIGNLWVGIPADVSDDVTQGIVEPLKADINKAVEARRLTSMLFLIPALTLFSLIIYAINKRRNRLFYIGMTLTIIPILITGILGLTKQSEMPYKNLLIAIICIPLIFGLLKGIREIFKSDYERV